MFDDPATLDADLTSLLSALAAVGSGMPVDQSGGGVGDSFRVDLLTVLERVKAGCAAAQARVTADLVDSQDYVAEACRDRAEACAEAGDFVGWRAARDAERAAMFTDDGRGGVGGVGGAGAASESRASRRRRGTSVMGVAGQVGLARRVSPHRGSRHVNVALALVHELPFVMAALEAGAISERLAELVVTEMVSLTSEQRRQVDSSLRATLGGEPAGPDAVVSFAGLSALGDRDLVRRVRAVVYELDPATAVQRCAYAETQRRVSVRPAPDAMTWVTALLPVAQGVAVLAALTRDAATEMAAAAAVGGSGGVEDVRSKGQVMADRLVQLVTGQAVVGGVPVEVQLVMTDQILLGTSHRAASVRGYGPIPAGHAKNLIANTNANATDADVWVRRLYTDPVDGTLTGWDSGRRLFDGRLRRYRLARDETCRTPWCDAPVRHADHVIPYADGGKTTVGNGQGLCVRCNLVKEQAGWRHRTIHDQPHTVEVETPTGHLYQSQAPPVLPPVNLDVSSPLERALEAMLAA